MPRRIPIVYLIIGVLLLVSVVPIYFLVIRVVKADREQLMLNEQMLENGLTRALADDIGQRQANLRAKLANIHGLALAASGGSLQSARVRALLQDFVTSSPEVAYATVINPESRGASAGRLEPDIFMRRELERAFHAARDGQSYTGQPLAASVGSQPATIVLVSEPIIARGRFFGMIAAFEDLRFISDRLRAYSVAGMTTYVVDRQGRLVAAPGSQYAAGQDLTGNEVVRSFVERAGRVQFAPTMNFTVDSGQGGTRMIGTYALVPALTWAVVAQKSQLEAYAAVYAMQREAWRWAILAVLVSLGISVLAARKIIRPLALLTQASRAIAAGDFSRRARLQSRTEIGELAATFNLMAGNLEKLVVDLKRAAAENRALFLNSIQMLAGAVDERDPYTRGHSDRVTRYSVAIAREMGLGDDEVENIRVAAQLHDLGKIGIEDSILKKPARLTPEEYQLMKAHPLKGANILRPVEQLAALIPGVASHHESLDGGGYPQGLKGEAIPLIARVIMVADTFDAMTTERSYQAAMEPARAVEYIDVMSGKRFDPQVVAAFKRAFARGELAVASAEGTAALVATAAN
jgi:HD-GYP domain-containing protein (c-di-GMP phosphodiesterase class II)